METLACGHVALPGLSQMCRHLLVPEPSSDFTRLLTGDGLRYDLCCAECDQAAGEPDLLTACEGCVDRCDEEDYGYCTAWRGEPGIPERPESLHTTIAETPIPAEFGPIAGLAPIDGADESIWLLLGESGEIARFDAGDGTLAVLATCMVPAEPDHEPWMGHTLSRRLYASACGRFAAVVNDYGHHGEVIDLSTGARTMTLHGGDYRPDTVPFSFAFVRHDDRTLAVHRTAWNRLDVADPATGVSLTERDTAEHHLDYFHGALHPSPDGHWMADDGWVWSPVGVVRDWDLRRWLDDNPWESEDGRSDRLNLAQRAYHWDSPFCWVGDNLLAISGIGSDDQALLPGVRIFDVVSGAELIRFAGPRGALFFAGRRLYSAGPDGLDVWDPFTGERTGRLPGFRPAALHRGASELAVVEDGRLRRLTC